MSKARNRKSSTWSAIWRRRASSARRVRPGNSMSCKLLPGSAQASAIQWSTCQAGARPEVVALHHPAPQIATPIESGAERIAALEREAVAHQDAAYRRGFAEGQAAAGAQAAARVDPVLAKLAGTIAELG